MAGSAVRWSSIRLSRHALSAVDTSTQQQARQRDGEQGADDAAELETKRESEDRADRMEPHSLAHQARDQDVRLDQLDEDERDAHPDDGGQRHRRGNEQSRHRADDRTDHRYQLGHRGEERQEQRVRDAKREEHRRDEDAQGQRDKQLRADVRPEDSGDFAENT